MQNILARVHEQHAVRIRTLVYENMGKTVAELSELSGISPAIINAALLSDAECRAMAHQGYVSVIEGKRKPQWWHEAPNKDDIPSRKCVKTESATADVSEPKKRSSVDDQVKKLVELIKQFPQETPQDYAYRGEFSSAQKVNDMLVTYPILRRMTSAGMVAVPARGTKPAWYLSKSHKTRQNIPVKESIKFGQEMLDGIVIDPNMEEGLAAQCREVIKAVGKTRMTGRKYTAFIETVVFGTVGLAQGLDQANKTNKVYAEMLEKRGEDLRLIGSGD